MQKTKPYIMKYRQYIKDNIIDCDISYRGGTLKIDVSSLFPTLEETGEEAIMGASQNYLGGGIAGSISSGSYFDPEELSEEEQKEYKIIAEDCKRYFYELNHGGGDEYMHENVTGPDAGGYDATQNMPRSAY